MEPILASLRDAGIGIVAMKVMAGGFRTDQGGRPAVPKFQRDGAMLSMLKWVLSNKNVDTTIPSITDLDQLDQNCRPWRDPSPADEKTAGRAARLHPPAVLPHVRLVLGRCAKGLPVSDMVRFVSYAEGYGQFALARENFMELPEGLRERPLLRLFQVFGDLPQRRQRRPAGQPRAGALCMKLAVLAAAAAAVLPPPGSSM